MASYLIDSTVDFPAARCLLQNLFSTEADLIPDSANKLIHVRLHGASRPAANRSLARLISHLTKTELNYPGTDMMLVYEFTADVADRGG